MHEPRLPGWWPFRATRLRGRRCGRRKHRHDDDVLQRLLIVQLFPRGPLDVGVGRKVLQTSTKFIHPSLPRLDVGSEDPHMLIKEVPPPKLLGQGNADEHEKCPGKQRANKNQRGGTPKGTSGLRHKEKRTTRSFD